MESIISIRNLSFSYDGGKKVLDDINLEIHRGEIFGIIGPTGAGKSTLLHHLNGIIRGEGEICVDGIRIGKGSEREIRERVGLVFQNPDDQLFCPTVFEDVAFGLYNMGMNRNEVEEKVARVLKEIHLSDYRDLSSHHLSFGEKKRVAFATVLAMEPKVLGLDEPFANLDYSSILNIVRLIEKLDITRIVISQDILHAFAFCNRIAVLHRGRIIKQGTPAEIAGDHGLLQEVGLDYRPYLQVIKKFF